MTGFTKITVQDDAVKSLRCGGGGLCNEAK